MIGFVIFLKMLFNFPKFLFLVTTDYVKYRKEKGYTKFEGWGLHLFVGRFGAGKTISMVKMAYDLAKRYPSLSIVTNLQLSGFPAHTQILPLRCPSDILKAPENTLVLIDEIGTIFNSRDFAKSKDAIPKVLFQHLCQCRKRHMEIFATTQRWNFLDKQLRDITATVTASRVYFKHPFSRMVILRTYDSVQYDRSYTNPLIPIKPLGAHVYLQTDEVRNLYDTAELIENMLSAEYIDDAETLANQQGVTESLLDIGKKTARTARRNGSRLGG